ncbi:MAG TPA: hypothetical protein VEK07_24825 [Polyangiaceae bacterium]|nr:hypothetical protein [Polyangiaceae bacterium]
MIQGRAKWTGIGASGWVALIAACSSHNETRPRSATADASTNASSPPDELEGDGALSPDAAPGALAGCATSTLRATQTPVDVYFVIDTSGSMDDLVGPQESKWSGIVSALTAFVDDPASGGLGVGLQYFPTTLPGVPTTCSHDQDCGPGSPCLLGVCSDANEEACASGGDCQGGVACVPISTCANDANTLCVNFGAPCGADPNGFDLGNCGDALTTSYCANGDSCSPADYAHASVPIASLPGSASALVTSLQGRHPAGSTPTQAALQGAVNTASTYAQAHPSDTVVIVLATDGAPDETADSSTGLCAEVDPSVADAQVAQVAAAAFAGTPSIQTFAIGVFTPDDVAAGTATLNQIATSGGTGSPFIINATSEAGGAGVAQQFIDALAQVRAASLPCQFTLPAAAGVNLGQLNVSYTSGAGAISTVSYVETPGACNPSTGGWYYDADPAEGGTPTMIDVCPTTCTELKSDPNGIVTIVLGCQTIVR